jgi:multiple sugar transport system ATP-binding protein
VRWRKDAKARAATQRRSFWRRRIVPVAVSLRRVRKRYGATDVIHGLDLDIRPGEFVVLVGPSGCGKSTLLRAIAGLEEVSAGEIVIGGEVVNDIDAADRDIAMVFQSYALYPHMTVRGNLSFALAARRSDARSIERRIANASSILGIEALLDRYPRELSGGQRQRVAMGRAIVRDPRLFLFDEPLSNLDANLRVQMRVEIKALHRRLGCTAIYVTHDQTEAMTMADRIVLMREGRIEQVGAPLELYDRPATQFVARFIGSPSMNMIAGVAATHADGPALLTDDGHRFRLPADARVEPGRAITLGVRAEHFALGAPDGHACEIETTEPLGREILLYGNLGRQAICVAPGSRPAVAPGDTVRLGYDVDRACVFDAASGRSLRDVR